MALKARNATSDVPFIPFDGEQPRLRISTVPHIRPSNDHNFGGPGSFPALFAVEGQDGTDDAPLNPPLDRPRIRILRGGVYW
jgi:hypothetical protein